MDIPFFQLCFPPTLTDGRALEFHRQDFWSLVRFLEEQTGRTSTSTASQEVVAELAVQGPNS